MTTSDASTRLIGGRYRLDRSIGSGGMGTVWHGLDELLGREVAVKEVRFPPEIGAREQVELRERTLREARATARLSHPNVVTTYDVVEEDGRPYIVMELLPTRSLGTMLREDGPLPPHRVAQIGLDMLGALEMSHGQGVVHRDVKPSNVLLTADGRAVLTDFGIATMAGDPALTSTGVVLGSPAYMSPERARGKKPGPEADLWSLGATLYAAVEGRPPYDSENALGTLTAVITDPVTPPAVTGPLRETILGLLAKDPAERMSISYARALLTKAAGDRSSAPLAAPADATVALERGGRIEALPPASSVRQAAGPDFATPPPFGLRQDAVADPYDSYEDPDDRPGRSHRGLLVGALLVALLVIGGLVGLALTSGGDDPGTTKADAGSTGGKGSGAGGAAGSEGTSDKAAGSDTGSSAEPGESGSPDPAQSPEAQSPSVQSPEAAESTATNEPSEPDQGDVGGGSAGEGSAGGGAPAGFRTYRDSTGFSLAVPRGWEVQRRSATAIDLQAPGGSQFLRIDQTSTPKDDPVADWQAQESSVSARLPNYQRLRIEPADFNGWPAADWEFTFGNYTHVINRGFVPNANRGYAIYASSREEDWQETLRAFQTATESFRPAGG